MKYSTRIKSIGPRGVLLLAALLAAVAALTLFTIGEMKAQGGPALPGSNQVPTTPKLTASAKEGNVIELSWTSVLGAVRYELWTWPDDGWEQLDDGALTGTTYSHIGLSAGTTYYYQVRAVAANGVLGAWSETVGTTASETLAPWSTGRVPMPPSLPDEGSYPPGPGDPGQHGPGGPALPGAGSPTVNGPGDPGQHGPGGPALPGAGSPTVNGPGDPAPHGPGGPASPGATATATATSTPTPTPTPTATATATATSTFTPTPTLTPTSEPTATPTATASALLAPGMTAEATVRGVELSWEVAAGAVRYELSTWWDEGIGWQSVGGDNLTGTTYTHTEVAAGTTYWYSIRAVNAAGETSGWLMEFPSATALATDSAKGPVTPMRATIGRGALNEL